jgi:two-component system sensor histidine kinase VicK
MGRVVAALSDGVFLIRGEEIIALNPVAEKILAGSSSQKLELSGQLSVIKAAAQSLPVTFVLELPASKLIYLLQSFSLAEQTLVVAQDVTLSRENGEIKNLYLGMLTHDVKTPLTSLTMATRLLKKNIDQVPVPALRNLILSCAEDVDRLRNFLEDLIAAFNFDAFAERLDIQNYDLGKIFRHSVQAFQSRANDRVVILTQKIVGLIKNVSLPMDASKVAWAFSNLVMNGLSRSLRGGKVEARLECFDEWVEIRVCDNGPVIPFTVKVFEKSNSPGMDRYLSMVREIVVSHGGRIWLESPSGLGTEFCFTIPCI